MTWLLWIALAHADCPATVSALTLPAWASAADARLSGDALVVVFKDARRLGRYRDGDLAGCWPVGLGMPLSGEVPRGPKRRQGDHRTPEGWYRTSDKPWSSFYAAIAVHYPNVADAAHGVTSGLIRTNEQQAIDRALARDRKPPQQTALGGEILIHGGGSGSDWTLGCIAMDDADIDALRASLPTGMKTDALLLP